MTKIHLLVTLVAILIYGMLHYYVTEAFPRYELQNVSLSDTMDAVTYKLGIPNSVIDPPYKFDPRWKDDVWERIDPMNINAIPSDKTIADFNDWRYINSYYLVVTFNPTTKLVNEIECSFSCGTLYFDKDHKKGVSIGTSETEIKNILGNPSFETASDYETTKTLGYKNFNVKFQLDRGKVYRISVKKEIP
jgi:hypothetical protein